HQAPATIISPWPMRKLPMLARMAVRLEFARRVHFVRRVAPPAEAPDNQSMTANQRTEAPCVIRDLAIQPPAWWTPGHKWIPPRQHINCAHSADNALRPVD
ncbi:hypothetical protein CSC88_28765, partial [Klebsiella pneumoniae]